MILKKVTASNAYVMTEASEGNSQVKQVKIKKNL